MSLFRAEAVRHQGVEADEAMKVSPPWTWGLFVGFGGMFLAFLVWSVFGRVPVSERGRGILQPIGGPRVLVSTVMGRVKIVRITNGQVVKTGDIIMEVEAPNVTATALVAEREQKTAQGALNQAVSQEGRLYLQQKQRILARLQAAREQTASLDKSFEMQRRKLTAQEKLYTDQLISAFQVDEAREGLEQVRRQQHSVKQLVASLEQERMVLDGQQVDRSLQRKRDISRVDATAEGQAMVTNQTLVLATTDGVVEGVQVNPGDSIQAGDEVGRIMPASSDLEVVAFLPEKHQAFVRAGHEAFLEIDQLPYGEFGSARARVKRVAKGTVSQREIQAVLGPSIPGSPEQTSAMIRIELELLDRVPAKKAGVTLQAGMRLQVRVQIRRQSLLSMVMAPLRRWMD